MYCSQQLTHIIRQGDNLYQLAKYYQTTVPHVLSLNPSLDPYNLQVGGTVLICPGIHFQMQQGHSNPPACPSFERKTDLMNRLRLRWSQHVYWTRMLLVSMADRMKDVDAVTARLLQNPYDIAKIFAGYYASDVSGTIARLLTEHLQIGAALIAALRDGKNTEAESLDRQWYRNADEMAGAFAGVNPYYGHEAMREMLYQHLDLTKQEVAMRLAGNYPADSKAFDAVEEEALAMADAFSSGLIQQFPQMF